MKLARLSGYDASLLVQVPSLPLTGCALWELDTSTVPGGFTFARFREALSARMPALPEFRMKLADSVLNMDSPVWVEDTEFDLDRHLHRVELPAPGGRDELMEFVGQMMAGALDHKRPLWDMWVIEGLSGDCPGFSGKVAVMHRMHHTLGDGLSALDILSRLTSLEPDSPVPPALEGVGTATKWQIIRTGMRGLVRRPWLLLTRVLPTTVAGVIKARAVTRRAHELAIPLVFNAPRIAFSANVSDKRTVAFVQLDLDDVKVVKERFEVTVNDVMLALVAGALRRFLIDRDMLPKISLVAQVPMSVYREDNSGRNQLSSIQIRLFTGIADPVERLTAIAAATPVAKEFSSAVGLNLLQDWMECIPAIMGVGLRMYRWSRLSGRLPMYNLTISNVRGPEGKCYLMGAAVRARYAFGPVFDGAGLNVTIMSLNGKLDVGLVSCSRLLPELWSVAEGLPAALQELLDAAESKASDVKDAS
jgi:diacylglycerol O-acyltransferase / wax synthase